MRVHRLDISPRWGRVIVWAMILAYAGLFGWLSISRHHAFKTLAYDLGNVNQALWNTVHGRLLYFTNWRGVELSLATDSRLAMHVEPIYGLIAPIYALYQQPETLLILQTVVLALGAWPVYWLASRHLGSRLTGIAFAAVYLLFPGLQAANLWEFHAVALAAPLLLYAFYFGDTGRWGLLWLFAVLAMATKEEVPLTVMLMGLYFAAQGVVKARWQYDTVTGTGTAGSTWLSTALRRPQVIHGLALAAVAALWFAVAVFAVIPHFEGQGSPYLSYYQTLFGEPEAGLAASNAGSPATWSTLLSRRNLQYLIDLYTPVGFLSLLSPLTMAFSAPDLAINLLSDHEPMHFVQKYHYVAPVLPGVMISAILGSAWLVRRLASGLRQSQKGIALILTILVLAATGYYHYFHGYTPLARAFEPYNVTPHHELGREIARSIPVDAAVSAQRGLNPHVSGRQTLYRFPYIGDAGLVFLDVSSLENRGEQFDMVRDLIAGSEFGLTLAQDGYLLFQRDVPSTQALTDEFFGYLRLPPGSDPSPQYATDVRFTGGLRLVGFDVHYGRRTEMPQTPLRFTLYWQVDEPPGGDYDIGLYLLDERRNVIGAIDYDWEPGQEYWFPTSKWQTGETVRLDIDNMPWWTEQFDSYGVAVGLVQGSDPWDVGARVRPQIASGDLTLLVADSGTLVELMQFRTDAGGMPVPVESWRSPVVPRGITRQETRWINGLELVGYEITDTPQRPGDELEVTLYWRTGQLQDQDYTVFVHLVDEDGRLAGQHDAQPALNGLPTTRWEVGEVITDRHVLSVSAEAPPGSYRLITGFYLPATGQRVPLEGGGDAVELGTSVRLR